MRDAEVGTLGESRKLLPVWAPEPGPGAPGYVKEGVRAIQCLGSLANHRYLWFFNKIEERGDQLEGIILEIRAVEDEYKKTLAKHSDKVVALVGPRNMGAVIEKAAKIIQKNGGAPVVVYTDKIYSPLFDPMFMEYAWEMAPDPGYDVPPNSVLVAPPVSSEIDRIRMGQVARRLDAQGMWLVFWGQGNEISSRVLPVEPNVLWFRDVYLSQLLGIAERVSAVLEPYFDGITYEALTAWRAGKPVWFLDGDPIAIAKYPVYRMGTNGVEEDQYLYYCEYAWRPRMERILERIEGGEQ